MILAFFFKKCLHFWHVLVSEVKVMSSKLSQIILFLAGRGNSGLIFCFLYVYLNKVLFENLFVEMSRTVNDCSPPLFFGGGGGAKIDNK